LPGKGRTAAYPRHWNSLREILNLSGRKTRACSHCDAAERKAEPVDQGHKQRVDLAVVFASIGDTACDIQIKSGSIELQERPRQVDDNIVNACSCAPQRRGAQISKLPGRILARPLGGRHVCICDWG
jgi:hypothetical protein